MNKICFKTQIIISIFMNTFIILFMWNSLPNKRNFKMFSVHTLFTHNTKCYPFCFCYCLYINTSSHIVSFNQIKKYYNNKHSKFLHSKRHRVRWNRSLSLFWLAAARRYTQPRSNGTKMNNFCFIIVLLYTHNEQSLSCALRVILLCQ